MHSVFGLWQLLMLRLVSVLAFGLLPYLVLHWVYVHVILHNVPGGICPCVTFGYRPAHLMMDVMPHLMLEYVTLTNVFEYTALCRLIYGKHGGYA